jgi:hypothetical protein
MWDEQDAFGKARLGKGSPRRATGIRSLSAPELTPDAHHFANDAAGDRHRHGQWRGHDGDGQAGDRIVAKIVPAMMIHSVDKPRRRLGEGRRVEFSVEVIQSQAQLRTDDGDRTPE